MPEYLSPGVYVEEIPTGPRPIEGVSTHTAGMAGQTERGPEQARLVTSWTEFRRWYGGFLPPDRSYLPYAVQGFFENGGQRLYVARVAGAGADFARGDLGALHIHAIGRGAWGNRLFVRIRESAGDEGNPNRDPDLFGIDVLYYGEGNPPPLPLLDPLDPDECRRSQPPRAGPGRVVGPGDPGRGGRGQRRDGRQRQLAARAGLADRGRSLPPAQSTGVSPRSQAASTASIRGSTISRATRALSTAPARRARPCWGLAGAWRPWRPSTRYPSWRSPTKSGPPRRPGSARSPPR